MKAVWPVHLQTVFFIIFRYENLAAKKEIERNLANDRKKKYV